MSPRAKRLLQEYRAALLAVASKDLHTLPTDRAKATAELESAETRLRNYITDIEDRSNGR